jgi:hypothetical protein
MYFDEYNKHKYIREGGMETVHSVTPRCDIVNY